MSSTLLRAGLTVAALLLLACDYDRGRGHPGSSARLPELVLAGLSGETGGSAAELRGSALIVNFWATWCAPCRAEMPSLQRLSQRLAGQGMRVIGITIDADVNLAREFVRAQGLTFPNYIDGIEKKMQTRLGIRTLPETVLVAPDGAIRARIAGGRDWDSADSIRLLEEAFGLRLEAPRDRDAARLLKRS